jgi:hypothetical protein
MTRSECIDFVRKSVRCSSLSTWFVCSSSCVVVLLFCLGLPRAFAFAFAVGFVLVLLTPFTHSEPSHPIVFTKVAHAMARDGSSGGTIRLCIIDKVNPLYLITLILSPTLTSLHAESFSNFCISSYVLVFSLTLSSCLILFFLSCLL